MIDAVIIHNNPGGSVIQYVLKRNELEHSKVIFRGKCDSACTILISIKDSCISPNASFGFHLPHSVSQKNIRKATSILMNNYPSWVKRWIASQGGLSNSIKRMNYKYASQYMRTCD